MKRGPSTELEPAEDHLKKIFREYRLEQAEPDKPSLAHFDAFINVMILGEMNWSSLLKMRQVSKFFKQNVDQSPGLFERACQKGLERFITMCTPSTVRSMADPECHGNIWKCSCNLSPDNPMYPGYQPTGIPQDRQSTDAYCMRIWVVPRGVGGLKWLANTAVLNPVRRCACISSALVLNVRCARHFTPPITGRPHSNPSVYLKRIVQALYYHSFHNFGKDYLKLTKWDRIDALAGVFVFGGWPLFHHIVSLGKVHPQVIEEALEKINKISH